jgi:ABC-type sulfate transport system substrate-binding protein
MGLFDRIKEASDNVQAGLDLRNVDPELLANGLAGTALVTGMHDTKIAFGQHAFSDPVVAFELEVRLPERQPYAVAFQQRVPHLLVGAVIPGATVSVCVDRSDSQRVAIDFEQAPVPPATRSSAGASADPLDQLERLAKLHEQGVITDAELAEQKQKLLGEI